MFNIKSFAFGYARFFVRATNLTDVFAVSLTVQSPVSPSNSTFFSAVTFAFLIMSTKRSAPSPYSNNFVRTESDFSRLVFYVKILDGK